jgi:hypothetical protein
MPRTLSIKSPVLPKDSQGQPVLEPVRLSGQEGVNSLFEYHLTLKTPDIQNYLVSKAADFNLDDFIGREITCQIQLDGKGEFILGTTGKSTYATGSGTREINALITDAAFLGEEGRHLRYQLTLRPGSISPPSPPTAKSSRIKPSSKSSTPCSPTTPSPSTNASLRPTPSATTRPNTTKATSPSSSASVKNGASTTSLNTQKANTGSY